MKINIEISRVWENEIFSIDQTGRSDGLVLSLV